MTAAPFNTVLLSKIRELLGEIGPKKNRAVRWSEIEEIYANARAAGAEAGGAAVSGGGKGGSQVRVGAETAEELLERVEELRGEAEEAAERAGKAISLADQLLVQHGAAVEGFMSSIGRELEEHRLQAVTKTELQLSLDSVSMSAQGFQRILDAPGDVTAGAAVAVAAGAAAIGQTGTVLVTEGATARVTSGTTNGAWFQIPLNQSLVYAGQRIRIAVLARRPVTGAANAFSVAYAGGDGNSGAMASGNTTAGWAWHTFFYNCPAAAVGGPANLGLFGDNAKAGGTTDFARVVIELAAVAGELPEIETLNGQITELRGLDLDGLDGTAFGVLLSQLQVNAGGSSATISQQGTAIATLQGNATASYVFRAQAGSSNALLELVAASNPNGSVSTARIAADNILLKGSVAMEHLVVTDLGGNQIPNGAFAYGDLRGWDQIPNTFSIYDQATDTTNPGLTSPTQYGLKIALDAANSWNGRCLAYLPCRPGDRFSLSFQYAVAGATRDATLSLFINWYDKTGAVISWTYLTEANASSNAWATKTGNAQAPAGAAFGRVALRRLAGGAGTAYVTNVEIIRQRHGTTLITPGGLTTALIDTVDFAASGLAIFGGTVQSDNFNAGAGTGWRLTQAGTLNIPNAFIGTAHLANLCATTGKIANLAVDTLKIGDDAVTKFDYSYAAGSATTNASTFIMQSTVINKSRTQPLIVHGSLTLVSRSSQVLGVNPRVQLRDGTNGVVLAEVGFTDADITAGKKIDIFGVDTNSASGNITYQLRVTGFDPTELTCNKRFIGALNTFK